MLQHFANIKLIMKIIQFVLILCLTLFTVDAYIVGIK